MPGPSTPVTGLSNNPSPAPLITKNRVAAVVGVIFLALAATGLSYYGMQGNFTHGCFITSAIVAPISFIGLCLMAYRAWVKPKDPSKTPSNVQKGNVEQDEGGYAAPIPPSLPKASTKKASSVQWPEYEPGDDSKSFPLATSASTTRRPQASGVSEPVLRETTPPDLEVIPHQGGQDYQDSSSSRVLQTDSRPTPKAQPPQEVDALPKASLKTRPAVGLGFTGWVYMDPQKGIQHILPDSQGRFSCQDWGELERDNARFKKEFAKYNQAQPTPAAQTNSVAAATAIKTPSDPNGRNNSANPHSPGSLDPSVQNNQSFREDMFVAGWSSVRNCYFIFNPNEKHFELTEPHREKGQTGNATAVVGNNGKPMPINNQKLFDKLWEKYNPPSDGTPKPPSTQPTASSSSVVSQNPTPKPSQTQPLKVGLSNAQEPPAPVAPEKASVAPRKQNESRFIGGLYRGSWYCFDCQIKKLLPAGGRLNDDFGTTEVSLEVALNPTKKTLTKMEVPVNQKYFNRLCKEHGTELAKPAPTKIFGDSDIDSDSDDE